MNRKLNLLPRLMLGLLIAAGGAWAQAPDQIAAPLPPPPDGGALSVVVPDLAGHFLFAGKEFAFENHLKPVTGAPFSAQASTQTTEVLTDGNRINRSETAELYRDGSGRTRRDATISHIGPWSAASTPRRIVHISDPVAGTNYLLDVTNKTAVKMMPGHEPKGDEGIGIEGRRVRLTTGKGEGGDLTIDDDAAGPPNITHTTEQLGTQMMDGVTVQGTRTTETIPAGSIGNESPIVITSERWTSPELQTLVYSKHVDPRFGTTIYQLTNIVRQEPDPSLFQVPADYTVKEGPAVVRIRGRQ